MSDPDVYTFGLVSAINDDTSVFEWLVIHVCECAPKVTLPLEADPSRATEGEYLNKVDITRYRNPIFDLLPGRIKRQIGKEDIIFPSNVAWFNILKGRCRVPSVRHNER